MWNWNYTNVNNKFFTKWSPELAFVKGGQKKKWSY